MAGNVWVSMRAGSTVCVWQMQGRHAAQCRSTFYRCSLFRADVRATELLLLPLLRAWLAHVAAAVCSCTCTPHMARLHGSCCWHCL